MGRNRLLARLRDAEAEAQQDRTRILKQKVAIAALRAMGVNASEAEQTLLIFERAQDAHLSEIERIKDALNSGIFTDEVIRS
jgi:Holliday junction resolvasome RuvABC DNA-binding subunit